MRRPADASIGGDDDIVGIVLRTGVTTLADLRSPPPTADTHDLILVDSSHSCAGGDPGSSQSQDFRSRCEDRDQ